MEKEYLKIAGNIHLSYYVEAADILGIKYEIVVPYLMAHFSTPRKHWFVINTVNPLINAPSATIAKRKNLTNLILKKESLPVPEQEILHSERDALLFWEKYKNIVIKPLQALGGKGVSILPHTEEEIVSAYKNALLNSKSKGPNKVLGEQFISGKHYRLLVLGDKVIGAVQRTPASVKGDGKSSIEQLIRKENEFREQRLLMPIPIDDQTHKKLALSELTIKSIPTENEVIETRLHANMTAGGTTTEYSERIHPYYKKLAVDAVKAIGLEFGGVDLIALDIKDPAKPCAINEINFNPGLRLHYKPSKGKIVKVAIPIMEYISKN